MNDLWTKERETEKAKYENTGFFASLLLKNFYNSVLSVVDRNFSILEVGCGEGYSTKIIQPSKASEFDPVLAERSQKRNPDISVSCESVYGLQRSNDSFGTVVLLEVLEHLESPEAALQELKRVSSKYVIVSVPNEPIWSILNFCRGKYWSDFGNSPGHIQKWSRKEFVRLVGKYFTVVTVKTPLPWTIVLAKKP